MLRRPLAHRRPCRRATVRLKRRRPASTYDAHSDAARSGASHSAASAAPACSQLRRTTIRPTRSARRTRPAASVRADAALPYASSTLSVGAGDSGSPARTDAAGCVTNRSAAGAAARTANGTLCSRSPT
jgi:hypothetical protein